jgi:hypothetical protein
VAFSEVSVGIYAHGRKEEWQLSSHVGYSILSSYNTVTTGNFLPALLEFRIASLITSRHLQDSNSKGLILGHVSKLSFGVY